MVRLSNAIREELRQRAKADHLVPDIYFLRWINEGFLRRLAHSQYADRFALKGAHLFIAWNGNWRRSTRDIDLEGLFDDDAENTRGIVRQICETRLHDDDGITFHLDTLEDRPLTAGFVDGARLTLRASIDGAKVWTRIDVSYGRPIWPFPKIYRFPSILSHGETPEILGATKESALADRLALMVEFGCDNTRLKDYFDVWSLANSSAFRADRLTWAIAAAFRDRDAQRLLEAQEDVWSSGFADEFVSPSANRQWNNWLDRQSSLDRPSLPDVVARVRMFATPLLGAIHDRRQFTELWNPREHWHSRTAPTPRRQREKRMDSLVRHLPR